MTDQFTKWDELENLMVSRSAPGAHPGLARITYLLKVLANPQDFPAIHIAGTNGKGSTSSFLTSLYQAGGYKVGLYTSPHLIHMGERLCINGNVVPYEDWCHGAEVIEEAIMKDARLRSDRPTYFETFTAVAFWLLKQAKVDIAVIETGLGGRLDATNTLLDKRMAVITPIGMDHMEFLGNTLEEIAGEKFGIMTPGCKALFYGHQGDLDELFLRAASQVPCQASLMNECSIEEVSMTPRGTDFVLRTPLGANQYRSSLVGAFQSRNASLALRATELLQDQFPLSVEARQKGVSQARWPGRMEFVSHSPDVMFDGAHNAHGLKALAESLKQLYGNQPLTLLFAAMADKNYGEGLKILTDALNVDLIFTQVPNNSRSATAEQLCSVGSALRLLSAPMAEPDMIKALQKAIALNRPTIVCGSLYFIGALRRWVEHEGLPV